MRSDEAAWRVITEFAQAQPRTAGELGIDALACTTAMDLLASRERTGAAMLIASKDAFVSTYACGVLTQPATLRVQPSPGLVALMTYRRTLRYPGGLGALQLIVSPSSRNDVLVAPLCSDAGPARVLVATAESITDDLVDALDTFAAIAAAAYPKRRDRCTEIIVRCASEPVLLLDADGTIRTASRGAAALLGVSRGELVRELAIDLMHPADAESLLRTLAGAREGQRSTGCELRCRHADGGWIHTHGTVTARPGICDTPVLILRLHDIRERKNLEAELAHLAYHDPQTGLANSALLRQSFQRATEIATRDGTGVGVVAASVDGVREIGETFGQSQADRIVAVVADRLRACARPQDTVARLGEHEFAILTAADPTSIDKLARDVADVLGQPVAVPHGSVVLRASVGLRQTEPEKLVDTDVDSLVHDATLALNTARRTAERAPQRYDEQMRRAHTEDLTIRRDLLRAIQDGEFLLYYQPIVELSTQRLTGVEALLRWQHPERGLIPPDRFIPYAEQSGLIAQLGAWALARACKDVSRLRATIDDALTISVNVSPHQLHSDNILDIVRDALSEAALPPAALCLEVTESALAHGTSAAKRLRRLRDLGIGVALDDFGTGYASYGQLQSLPFDTIKIDRSFTRQLTSTETNPALARDMIRMGHSLGLKIVAEGIETADQEQALRALRCEYGQGYRFGRPSPIRDVADRLHLNSVDAARSE
jgi:diguanylate cyclase (GGDEF)-like protein/PAS domain S-box-containing protein